MSEPQVLLEYLLPGIQAKGNGFVVGTLTADGRVVPFALLRVHFGQSWERRDAPRSRP